MRRRNLIIVVIILFVLIVGSAFFWLWMQSRQLDKVRPEPVDNNIVIDKTLTNQLEKLPPPSTEVIGDEIDNSLGIKQLAATFAERFGTYSSDDNFKAWQGLDELTTNDMQGYISDLISSTAYNPDSFEAYETKAISSRIKNINSTKDRAIVLVKTQRSHIMGNDDAEPYYQDILIDLIMINDEWKIDGARWQS